MKGFKKILQIVILVALVFSLIYGLPAFGASSRPRILVEKYSYKPDPAEAGKAFDFNFNLKNAGDRDARNLNIQLKNIEGKPTLGDFSPIGNSNYFYLAELDEGTAKALKLRLKSSEKIESGTYNLILILTYEDSGGREYSEQSVLGVSVLRIPKLEIKGLNYPTGETKAQSNKDGELEQKITADIVNVSNFPVNAVGVELKGELKVDTESFYIGALENGGFDTFEALILDNDSGRYMEKLIITYRNDFGQELKISKRFEVKIEDGTTKETDKGVWQKIVNFFRAIFGLGE